MFKGKPRRQPPELDGAKGDARLQSLLTSLTAPPRPPSHKSSRPLSRPAPLRHPNDRHGDRHRAKSEHSSTPFRPSLLGRRFGDELLDVIVLRRDRPLSSEDAQRATGRLRQKMQVSSADAAQQWQSSGNQAAIKWQSSGLAEGVTELLLAKGGGRVEIVSQRARKETRVLVNHRHATTQRTERQRAR